MTKCVTQTSMAYTVMNLPETQTITNDFCRREL